MKRSRHFIGVALMLAAAAASALANARDRRLLELPSGDFTVYSALNEKQTRSFASHLAAFDRAAAAALNVGGRRNSGPTRVFLLSSADWQEYFKPRANVVGFFSDDSGVGNDLVISMSEDLAKSHRRLFHEYAHFFIRTQFPGYCPPWFDEGLAELLSTAEFRDDRIVLRLPEDRLETLKSRPWIPTDALFKVMHASREYQMHTLESSFYAQSWLAMNYAFVVKPEVLPEMIDYVQRVNRGEPMDKAARAAFPGGLDALNGELRTYATREVFRAGQIPLPRERQPSQQPVRWMDAAESARTLGELGLRVQSDSTRVEALLLAALEARPNDARALAGRANALASADAGEAQRLLSMIGTLPESADPEVAVLMGDTQVVLAVKAQASPAAAPASPSPDSSSSAATDSGAMVPSVAIQSGAWLLARDAYARALRVAPTHLAAAHGFAITCIQLSECLDDSIVALTRAQEAAPANWLLAFDLASAHELKGSVEGATSQWQLVAQLARSGQVREHARARIQAAADAAAGPPQEAAPK